MKKIIKKWGSSLVIVLTKEEATILDLQEGDFVDVEIVNTEINNMEVKHHEEESIEGSRWRSIR